MIGSLSLLPRFHIFNLGKSEFSASILPESQVLLGTSHVVLGPKTQLRAYCVPSRIRKESLRVFVTHFLAYPLTDLAAIFITGKTHCLSRGEAVCSVLPPLMTWYKHWDAVGLVGSLVSHKGSSWSLVWTSRCPAYENEIKAF